MEMKDYIFSSESVSEGHPDKVADQISDAVLDAIIAQDPKARVACETLVTTGMVVLAGEITTTACVDYPQIARQTIREIGYNDSAMGFDWETCAVLTSIDRQSPDISQGVTEGEGLFKDQGAGDQGIMFGFACNETPQLMPMTIQLSHQLVKRLADVRKAGVLEFLRPDSKSQVSIEYVNKRPVRVDTVVISSQHTPEVTHEMIREGIIEEVVKKVVPAELMDNGPSFSSTRPAVSSSAVPWATADLPAARSSWTATAAMAPMAAGRSPEKTLPRWTVRPPTWGATWRKTSLPQASATCAKSRSPMLSA